MNSLFWTIFLRVLCDSHFDSQCERIDPLKTHLNQIIRMKNQRSVWTETIEKIEKQILPKPVTRKLQRIGYLLNFRANLHIDLHIMHCVIRILLIVVRTIDFQRQTAFNWPKNCGKFFRTFQLGTSKHYLNPLNSWDFYSLFNFELLDWIKVLFFDRFRVITGIICFSWTYEVWI